MQTIEVTDPIEARRCRYALGGKGEVGFKWISGNRDDPFS
jgi:hypothetical protein